MEPSRDRAGKARPVQRSRQALRAFLAMEASGGVLLVAAAAAALLLANSPLSGSYDALVHAELRLGVGELSITEDLQHWVNDALMAVFFFVVGLEIKRELVTGELRDRRAAALPAIAALGGVVFPALIFLALAGDGPEGDGWGIPMATDIAFAVGVLALLGDRVPGGAKLLLLSIAIVDDIVAIAVIAVVYTATLSLVWLAAAVAGLVAVVALRLLRVTQVWPYVIVGVFVWLATFESGIHATIAGVTLGLLTPTGEVGGRNVLEQLEHRLHPLSAFVIVPLFAFANAGVDLRGGALDQALDGSLALAVAVALVVGKTAGIGGAALLARRLGIGALPAGVQTRHVWGLAALGGIGFTVSLFVADLAYDAASLTDQAKVGIFAGSLISAVIGSLILRSGRRLARRELELPTS
ncbi:MAG: Na+/H+ antiporter NhaA [Actinobacteria bacterium]|nr:Na+/H+ antiporter NhaA [Actinomycetota bacterium]MBW3648123.1 Na+/H+ antiporter NhaA [Actinomycetota bacterium]